MALLSSLILRNRQGKVQGLSPGLGLASFIKGNCYVRLEQGQTTTDRDHLGLAAVELQVPLPVSFRNEYIPRSRSKRRFSY